MPAGGGNLDRASRHQLATDIRQIRRSPCVSAARGRMVHDRAFGRVGCCRVVWREPDGVVQGPNGFNQRRYRHDLETCDDRRLARVGGWKKDGAQSVAPGAGGDRQHASRGVDRAVEGQLAQQHGVGNQPALDDARCREDAERDRQIERSASLAHVGRRQVDRDAVRGKLEAGIADGAPDPVAALPDARIGQTDHRERRKTVPDIDFDVNGARVDAEHGRAPQARQHLEE